ncbi:BspA family leucine-rich repeat surface protein [Mycoplasma yeatsii]|nr:BspA family leucine-rich repeat surface protein [Mycoplasma yeatsii]
MKLNKKIVSIIGIATLVPASIAGIGAGIWYSQTKIKDLSTLISKKDLGTINETDKTIQNLLKLIKQKNPSLDINKVELVIQENKVIVKPKTGDKTYKGEVEITFSLTNIDLTNLIKETNLGTINESDKTNENLLKLIKEKNPSLDINKVELVIQENKVIVKPKTGEKSYKGEVEITFSLTNIDLTNLIKETNLGPINESDKTIQNLLKLIKQKNPSLDINKVELVIQENKVIVKPKNGDITYKGEVTINFTNKTKINEIDSLNTNAGRFNSNSPDLIISQFIENNKDKLQNLTKDDFNVVSNDNGKLKIKVKSDNTQYQGEIEVTYSVRDQFNSIEKIKTDITDLKNNDSESVLNRFVELNSSLLDSNKITREQLKAIVNDDVATINIDGNDKYQGSVEVRLSLSKQTNNYLGVLDNDDQDFILKEVTNKNDWNLSSNDLNIQVEGNTATITGKTDKNKKFIGSITAQFGLTATYKTDKKELTRIGFFKNVADEWQIEKIDTNTNKVVSVLPTFITSLKEAFEENKNTTISGLENWDTSNVTDMSRMFYKAKSFNQPLGDKFNTSKVTDMSYMFYEAKSFNQSLNWNTENVNNMKYMFYSAKKFNQNIGRWNTENVNDMEAMFTSANVFNQPIGNWNTSNVTNMRSMFSNAYDFNQNISEWNTSKVTNMSYMFHHAENFNQYIGDWNTSNVEKMRYMFAFAEKFNQNISGWNTSNVNDMTHMFENAKKFNQNISSWSVSKVTDMASMFREAKAFNQNISGWNVNNVKEYKDFNLNGIIARTNKPSKFR